MEQIFQFLANKSRELTWTNDASIVFENAKAGLANSTVLVYQRADAPTTLTIDVLETAVGGFLEQLVYDE